MVTSTEVAAWECRATHQPCGIRFVAPIHGHVVHIRVNQQVGFGKVLVHLTEILRHTRESNIDAHPPNHLKYKRASRKNPPCLDLNKTKEQDLNL